MKINIKNISRRKFLKRAIIAAVSIEFFYVLFGLTRKKDKQTDASKLFNAGKVSAFEKDKIYPFTSGKFYLSCFADGGFLAISIKCTHLGCMVQASSETGGYNCPCHASKFNKYGEVLSPPATRALDIFPVYFTKGELMVDTNEPIKRDSFTDSQLTYA